MKLTLLELCQDMLVAIDSENVSSVADTEEAGMCVNIVNRCYEDMMSKRRWKHLRRYANPTTTTNLNELVLPTGTIAVDPFSIYYNGRLVHWLEAQNFLDLTIRRDVDEDDIALVGDIKCYTDRDPTYVTSDDDETLMFDAIPSAVNGLDGNDCQLLAYVGPTSRLTDDTEYFDLPYSAYPALSLYSRAMAVGELKGDTQKAALLLKEYKRALMELAYTGRLIDKTGDRRKWIVPRSRRSSNPVFTGNYWINF